MRCSAGPSMLGGVNGGMTNGVQNSMPGFGNWNPSGSTPTTVCGSSSRTTGVPTMSGSEAKRLVQAPWPSSTTLSAPPRASSSVKSRPRWGAARSSGNSDGETEAPDSVTAPSGPAHCAERSW